MEDTCVGGDFHSVLDAEEERDVPQQILWAEVFIVQFKFFCHSLTGKCFRVT